MTKKILVFLLFTVVFAPSTFAQHTLSDNRPYFDDQRWHFGGYIGLNWYDFKLTPKQMTNDTLGIRTEVSTGFSAGMITDFKLNDYFNIRFEPGLDITGTRKLTDISDNSIDINSVYMNLPILLKFGGKRRHNVRPYLISGFNLGIDFNPNKDDTNKNNKFIMTKLNYSWQAGAGIDWYTQYGKVSTEIRGSFGINDEFTKNGSPPESKTTTWANQIDKLQTRAVFFVLKLE